MSSIFTPRSLSASTGGSISTLHWGQIRRCQSLSNYEVYRTGNEKRLHPHIQQSVDGLGRIIGVKSADSTMCPVRAAFTPISAVSKSRISPTMMISGSCLRNDRKRRCKGQSNFFVHLDLVDPEEVEFYRILCRGYVYVHSV